MVAGGTSGVPDTSSATTRLSMPNFLPAGYEDAPAALDDFEKALRSL